jgi:transposase
MPNPYDVALRERAVKAYERGDGTYAALGKLFAVHQRTLQEWVAQWRATGSLEPRPKGGGWTSPIQDGMLEAVVRERPDATLQEICLEYNRRVSRAQRTTRSALHRALDRLGFVHKKNGRGRARSNGQTLPRSARRL